jgi:competence protein ComEA
MKIIHSLIFPILFLGFLIHLPQALATPTSGLTGVVNLNTATIPELSLLPGIGPVKAGQIVALRQKQPLQSLEDLKKIHGLGPKRLEALRPHVSFVGPSTAKRAAIPSPETQATVNPQP